MERHQIFFSVTINPRHWTSNHHHFCLTHFFIKFIAVFFAMCTNGNTMDRYYSTFHTMFDGFVTKLLSFFFFRRIKLVYMHMTHNAARFSCIKQNIHCFKAATIIKLIAIRQATNHIDHIRANIKPFACFRLNNPF